MSEPSTRVPKSYPVILPAQSETLAQSVAYFVRRERRVKDMSQAEMGRAIGATQSTIARYETGVVPITLDTLDEIARCLGCKPSAILSAAERRLKR